MRKCICKTGWGFATLRLAPPDRIVTPFATQTPDPAPILDLTEIAVAEFVATARQLGAAPSAPGHLGSAFANLVTCRMACERSGERFEDALTAALRPGGRLEARLGPLSAALRAELRHRLESVLDALDALARAA
jgi:hypothetical protein